MSSRIRPVLITIHRWMGVGLVTLFLLWFPSGIVMMYWGFPEVTEADRLEHAIPLNPATVTLTPVEAFQRAGLVDPPTAVRLGTFDDRPVYRFRDADGESVIYADTGEMQVDVPDVLRRRIAAGWARQSIDTARETAVTEVDQWTVGGSLRTLRPLWKYAFPNGDEVYVAGATGEVVQATTRRSRVAAYLGAIPHWLYFTPIRKHPSQWSQFVIWASGLATAGALLGIVIAVWMYSPRKRYRYLGATTSIPYRGQKRWHTVLGLTFGIVAVTWAFSGMLSMDPWPRGDDGQGARLGQAVARSLRGTPQLNAFAMRTPRQALEAISSRDVAALDLMSFAGRPVYVATLRDGGTRIVPLQGDPVPRFDTAQIAAAIRSAVSPTPVDVRVLTRYDKYYLDRRGERPLPVVLAQIGGAAASRYYIDPGTARIVGGYAPGDWMERWLYHGLHSLDFPWLYAYRPLWDVVVLTLLGGGTALCVTSLVLAWRVLGRKLSASVRTRSRSDDLAAE